MFLKVNVAVIYKDPITAADFYFYTLLNKSSLNFENKGKWKRPDSCVSKEVLYSLSANLQYLYHYKRVNEPKMFRNPSQPWNSLWSRKRQKIFFWSRHLENTLIESQQQCSLTIACDNLKYTEVYKSDAKNLYGV